MKPTIWIVNESGHPYHLALNTVPDATLRPFTIGTINPFRVDRLSSEIATGVVKYSHADDYVLLSGTPILNAIVIAIWLLHHRNCKILQWNAKKGEYALSNLSQDNLAALIEKEMTR